ncbi:MAG: hypothetical protein WAW06_04525 [bacterium]
MTAQINDEVFYKRHRYSIGGINGEGLFAPEEYGFRPQPSCTACWRGYYCQYAVKRGILVLTDLHLFVDREACDAARRGDGTVLFGVHPRLAEELADIEYNRLDHPVTFTGGLLIAAGFIQELYIHMGFHPAWKYREVHELTFEAGKLSRAADRSKEIAEFRRDMAGRGIQPGHTDPDGELMRWIEQCFDRRYNW